MFVAETVSFAAQIGDVSLGGDGGRFQFYVKDTDLAEAMKLIAYTDICLSVRAIVGAGKDAVQVAEFNAIIAPIQTALVFRSKMRCVKLDVAQSDKLAAARLVGYQDYTVRLEITPTGNKEPRKDRIDKGPHGKFWQALHRAQFWNCPGVREAVEEMRETGTEPVWEILHRVFGVGGASLAAIGPERVLEQFPPEQFPQVKIMVEQARRFEK